MTKADKRETTEIVHPNPENQGQNRRLLPTNARNYSSMQVNLFITLSVHIRDYTTRTFPVWLSSAIPRQLCFFGVICRGSGRC